MHWVKTTLQDPKSERFVGWDSAKKRYDDSRRVAIVMGNYIVVIALLREKERQARFITAYVGDTVRKKGRLSTIELIRSGPIWKEEKPLIRQAGSAGAFLDSATSGGE